MKKNSTIAGAGKIRRHALTATFAAWASLATLGQAATFNSPVGKWDCIMSGSGQEGITVIEFFDTGSTNGRTFKGYQLLSSTLKKSSSSSSGSRQPGQKQPSVETRGGTSSSTDSTSSSTTLFGFSTNVSGQWQYDTAGRVVGQFIQIVANFADPKSPTTNGVSFSAKVVPDKRLTMVASTPYGKVSYRGVPFEPLADISGSWQGVKKQDKQTFVEFFTLSAWSNYPNLYIAEGTGPGYYFSNGIVNFEYYTTNSGISSVTNAGGGFDWVTNRVTTNYVSQNNFNWCLLSTQKKIGFDITEVAGSNGIARASYGNFKSSKNKTSAKTKGIIVPSTGITFDAEKGQ